MAEHPACCKFEANTCQYLRSILFPNKNERPLCRIVALSMAISDILLKYWKSHARNWNI